MNRYRGPFTGDSDIDRLLLIRHRLLQFPDSPKRMFVHHRIIVLNARCLSRKTRWKMFGLFAWRLRRDWVMCVMYKLARAMQTFGEM